MTHLYRGTKKYESIYIDEINRVIRICFVNFTENDMNENIFRDCPDSIETVEIVLCTFEKLPWTLLSDAPFCKSLRTFHFINNVIYDAIIPEHFFDECINIQDIQISVSEIYELPVNLFMNNLKLQRINLSHNKLTQIHDNIFGIRSDILINIDITNNPISNISNIQFEYQNVFPYIKSEHLDILHNIYICQDAWKRRKYILLWEDTCSSE